MKYSTEKREIIKAKEIANEYKKKGFKVILEPSVSDLPDELKNLNFRPDIVATSDEIKIYCVCAKIRRKVFLQSFKVPSSFP